MATIDGLRLGPDAGFIKFKTAPALGPVVRTRSSACLNQYDCVSAAGQR